MLLLILSVLSLLAAAGIGCMTDAFCGFNWIWVLPVSFLGSFLVLTAAAFGILVLICSFIDEDKVRDEDSPWFRKMILMYIRAVLTVLPVKFTTQGLEKTPADGRFLLVCNHLHNIDPAFILDAFPKGQLSFVAKREAKEMFLVGKALSMLMGSFINRENDREALKTILRSISLIKQDKASVAIFPEGRINSYRKLAHFRPGVFKIAQKANVPVVVCTLRDTQYVLDRLLHFKSSKVELHLLDVIPAKELQNRTTVEIAEQIYEMMAQDLGPERVLTPEEEEKA